MASGSPGHLRKLFQGNADMLSHERSDCHLRVLVRKDIARIKARTQDFEVLKKNPVDLVRRADAITEIELASGSLGRLTPVRPIVGTLPTPRLVLHHLDEIFGILELEKAHHVVANDKGGGDTRRANLVSILPIVDKRQRTLGPEEIFLYPGVALELHEESELHGILVPACATVLL